MAFLLEKLHSLLNVPKKVFSLILTAFHVDGKLQDVIAHFKECCGVNLVYSESQYSDYVRLLLRGNEMRKLRSITSKWIDWEGCMHDENNIFSGSDCFEYFQEALEKLSNIFDVLSYDLEETMRMDEDARFLFLKETVYPCLRLLKVILGSTVLTPYIRSLPTLLDMVISFAYSFKVAIRCVFTSEVLEEKHLTFKRIIQFCVHSKICMQCKSTLSLCLLCCQVTK